MKGYVFDFKRFSTHDGKGIRTTVFLKGCPLRCVWCHNPEGMSLQRRPLYFPNKCIHCQTCVQMATSGGVTGEAENIILDVKKKENWAALIDACPAAALAMDLEELSAAEVAERAMADKPFFKYGGGVTLSGGEPLLQADFALEILKRLKENNVSTAIETALHVKTFVVERALPYLDNIFADCKIFDSDAHKKYVGTDNDLIKQNLTMLLKSPRRDDVIIRTPLIPGITATAENIGAISRFLSDIYDNVQYELLNYNTLAPAKYKMVDREYFFQENPRAYTAEQMRTFGKIAQKNGIKNLILEI